MKKLFKLLLITVLILILIVILAAAYLNFIYLPQKVKSEGAAFLKGQSGGRLTAQSIQYLPFKGVRLKKVAFVSKEKKPILSLETLYVNVDLVPLLLQQVIDFRVDLYLPGIKRPLIFKGLYQIPAKKLDLNCKLKTDLFSQSQNIVGRLSAIQNKDISLSLTAPDLQAQGSLHIKDRDLQIENLSVKILDSTFDFIGDAQNLNKPLLNIYGDFKLNLAGLKRINPKYLKLPEELKMQGNCIGKLFISGEAADPLIGLKMNGAQIIVKNTQIDDLSVVAKIEHKKVVLSKSYAKLYSGEINLEGDCNLAAPALPALLNINIFNLDLNKLITDITGKEAPVHGRFFSLGRFNAPLKNPRAVAGELWLSTSGSNILVLPLFAGIVDILRIPELRQVEFKEASGNFAVDKQQIKTSDFKIVSNALTLYFKGYMDFAGNLGFDIDPSFSENFLAAPNIGNILGVLTDSSTGKFMGEIKLKGNVKSPRYTFKPISTDNLLRRGIEEGLKQLFKFKEKEN